MYKFLFKFLNKKKLKNMEMKKNDYAIGIDLGTTYSCVGVYKNNKAEIIANSIGERLTPSCVSFTSNGRLIGRAAKNMMIKNYNNTIYNVKRLIGRNFNDETVQNDIKLLPFKVEKDENSDKPVISVEINGENDKFYPQQISAMVLSYLKQTAEDYLGQEVKDAVITVPAYFNAYQKKATKEAGEIAGLNVLRIINEPTAAAIAYGFNNNENNKIILVFDLGGGTYDVSILKIQNNKFQVLAINGNTHLGGEDFDNELVKHYAKLFEKENGINILNNNRAKGRLKKECEQAKKDLSELKETTIFIDGIVEGKDLDYSINRADLNEICKDLFEKCIPPIEQALKDADLKVTEINEVVLVGGSSRIPKIHEMIKKYFGDKILSKKINPDEAVGLGATIQAAIIKKEISNDNIQITDINPLSIGISVYNKNEISNKLMSIIIPKNCNLPYKNSDIYYNSIDYQENISINVYQGENIYVKDNYYIGGFLLKNIRKALEGEVEITVSMYLDEDGILKVKAKEKDTKNKKGIMIENVINLTKQQIEKFKQIEHKLQYDNQLNDNITKMKDKFKKFLYTLKEYLNKNPKLKKNQINLTIKETEEFLKKDTITLNELKQKYNNLKKLLKVNN